MKRDWTLTQESLDALLSWLDPRRDEAAREYEEIRRRLIRFFAGRGCCEPEDLADVAINRVAVRLKDIAASYDGDRVRYFHGVANKVHLEYLRRPRPSVPPPLPPDHEEEERECECLEYCLGQLSPGNRELFVEYFRYDKRAKTERRKRLAEELGIALNALRIRAHRLRALVLKCMLECLEQAAG